MLGLFKKKEELCEVLLNLNEYGWSIKSSGNNRLLSVLFFHYLEKILLNMTGINSAAKDIAAGLILNISQEFTNILQEETTETIIDKNIGGGILRKALNYYISSCNGNYTAQIKLIRKENKEWPFGFFYVNTDFKPVFPPSPYQHEQLAISSLIYLYEYLYNQNDPQIKSFLIKTLMQQLVCYHNAGLPELSNMGGSPNISILMSFGYNETQNINEVIKGFLSYTGL